MVRTLLVASLLALAGAVAHAEGQPKSVAYARVAMDGEGFSYFADGEDVVEIQEFAPPAGALGVAGMREAESVVFTVAEPGWNGDWHPAPRRQFVFLMGGAIDIEVMDGETRRFVQGDIILLEDTLGKGHDTRVVSAGPALFAIVALPE